MRRAISGAAIVIAVSLLTATLIGQSKPWSPPRTPDGQPDLTGVWGNATITPFERPASQANKPFLTREEAAALEQRTQNQRAQGEDTPRRAGDVGTYNQFWTDSGTTVLSTLQTSLVVDPPDGRVPTRPSAEKRRDDYLARSTDDPEAMSVWDRCITRGVPGSIFPAGYNNAYQIFQAPGYVVILYEMIHDARIIPITNRPHASQGIRGWFGDSRGHWEGNTLVVDVTNYNDKGWIASSAAGGRIKGIPHTSALHVVERFTRTAADTISYEATIDDPAIYTRPWKVAFPLTREADYRLYEYACHEGNHAVENILKGARVQQRSTR